MPSKLVELEIARPGVFGVNTSASGDIMPKEYSVQANNFVFSQEGYLEARHGSQRTHTTSLGVGETVRQIFVTKDENGNDLTIFSTDTKIFRKDGATNTDITGTITTPTTGNWKFINLNNEIYGYQYGSAAIKLATPSSGSFANVTFVAGTNALPTSGSTMIDAISAFGRLWAIEGDTLHYSDLLTGDDFTATTGDGGVFTMAATYLYGKDKPVALAEFNGFLIVFGEKHVTVWENPFDPNGISSAPMGVLETIGGVGCIARDSIQYTQNDILFLSEQGVTSLSRVVQEKSMPLKRYSDNIRKGIQTMIKETDLSNIWSVYLEGRGMYMIGSSDISKTYLIDTSTQLPDESYRCLTWSKSVTCMAVEPESTLSASDNSWAALLISDEAEYISRVKGYRDNLTASGTGGTTYPLTYESAWSSIVEDLENYLKFPKKLGVVVKGSGAVSFAINLAFDYGLFTDSKAKTGSAVFSIPSVYGEAQYTIGEYGSAVAIRETKTMGFGGGRIIKVKITTTVDGNNISLQRVSIKSKIGKQS